MTLSMSTQAAVMGQFHDLASPEEGEHWAKQMKSHSVGALWSEFRFPSLRWSRTSIPCLKASVSLQTCFEDGMC